MKRAIVVVLMAVAAVWMGGCQSVSREPSRQDDWVSQIVGTYKGIIWSGEEEIPATTMLFRDGKGVLSGKYEMSEEGGVVAGKLYECSVVGNRKMKCKWEDEYGTGDLSLEFSDDLSRFEGLWNADGDSESYLWNGAK
jgi:hypothetical protein